MNYRTATTTQAGYALSRVARTDAGLRRNYSGLLASLGCAAFLLVSAPALAQVLGAAQSFAILGGTAVTAAPPLSTINGDVGIDPNAATFITGFPANATILPPFVNQGNNAFAIAARAATTTLFNSSALAPAGGVAITANLSTGGPSANGSYTPGKYSLAVGTAIIPTSITLNGPGIYIFSLNSDITTSVGSTVILNGVDPCTVFWRVPTLATLNGVNFPGTVVAGTGVHLGTGSNLTGRALAAAAGDVTLAGGNNVGGCSAARLGLVKTVVNTGGGTAVAGDFTLTATGPVTISGAAPVAATNAPTGVYTLTETNLTGYTAGSFSCSGGTLSGNQLTIGLADAGNTITCTVVNTYTPNPARLALAKTVVNTGGGTALASAFTLTATGPAVISGTAPVAATNAPVGVYTLTETNLTGYTAGLFSCSGGGTLAGNLLTIAAADAGNTITCTITNTFNALPPGTSIPTLSEWTMILLAALMAITGFIAMRRKGR